MTDKSAAFDLALRGGFTLGIVYKELRPTLIERYQGLLANAKESSLTAMLDGFNARKGVAIGKPVG